MQGAPFKPSAQDALADAMKTGRVHVNPMSAWEIGVLVSKNRLSLSMPTRLWIAQVIGHPGLNVAEMPIEVLIESTNLPGDPPNDPVDRMMIALARDMEAELVTRDGKILAYSTLGYVKTLGC